MQDQEERKKRRINHSKKMASKLSSCTVSPRRTQKSLLVLIVLICASYTGHGLATSNINQSASCDALDLDIEKIKRTIASGRVYHKRNFLSESEVQLLLTEISELESKGMFQRSGLSNTVKGDKQGFGNRDRSTCAVPWWKDSLLGEKKPEGPQQVGFKMQKLRMVLAEILDRPTLRDASLAHECYYSVSDVGSVLPRHMDERHEELKGSKGWLLPSRRSVSWLVYLSDPGWDLDANGGALRSFPQEKIAKMARVGTHDGNLQVGWLVEPNDGSIPVFLDSWFQVENPTQGTGTHSILYAVDDNKDRVYLTRPWLNDALVGVSVADFVRDCSRRDARLKSKKEDQLFLSPEHANAFALIEDRIDWDNGSNPMGSVHVDTSPERASLVMFDSVLLPHEVRRIEKGTRIALAGWFHQETQPFPEGLYS